MSSGFSIKSSSKHIVLTLLSGICLLFASIIFLFFSLTLSAICLLIGVILVINSFFLYNRNAIIFQSGNLCIKRNIFLPESNIKTSSISSFSTNEFFLKINFEKNEKKRFILFPIRQLSEEGKCILIQTLEGQKRLSFDYNNYEQ